MSTSTAGRAAGEPRTAFVLAGGAALGAMQAGMVQGGRAGVATARSVFKSLIPNERWLTVCGGHPRH
jgi:hypothetical protein